jgi:hypothetical protein
MKSKELLADAFGRIRGNVRSVLRGLDEEQLAWRPAGNGNSIGWLIWHLSRVQDDHLADAGGMEQVWTAGDFAARFDLPLPVPDTGYGHTSEQVASVIVAPDLLLAYAEAVLDQSLEFVRGLTPEDLDRVVDTSWNPPVTLGVRLVSVISDCLQHLGAAAYLKGLPR